MEDRMKRLLLVVVLMAIAVTPSRIAGQPRGAAFTISGRVID
jgi:hypothetical protein